MSVPQYSRQSEVDHFRAIPWCAKHLDEPGVIADASISRFLKEGEADKLFSVTLNNKDCIPAFVLLHKEPENPNDFVTEIKALLTLGPGINGWPGVSHGGISVAILDDIMGQLPAVNRARGLMPAVPTMTVYLNTQFKKPVKTGRSILVKVRTVKHEGRKIWTEGVIYDEEGNECTKAEALFIELKSKL